MDRLSLHDPLLATYVIAASLMILKAVAMAWLTVVRMIEVKGGYRSPEDIKQRGAELPDRRALYGLARAGHVAGLVQAPGRSQVRRQHPVAAAISRIVLIKGSEGERSRVAGAI